MGSGNRAIDGSGGDEGYRRGRDERYKELLTLHVCVMCGVQCPCQCRMSDVGCCAAAARALEAIFYVKPHIFHLSGP